MFVPEKEGFVFTGWSLFGENYSFGETINQDVTLYANWVAAADMASFTGLYTEKEGDTRISVFSDGSVAVGAQTGFAAYGIGTDSVLYVTTDAGVTAYDLANNFNKTSAFEVAFEDGLGNTQKQFVEQGGKAVAPAFERAGYTLSGWTVKETQESFDITQAITENMTLVAVWAYDEADIADYAGSYYADGTLIVIGEDGAVTVQGGEYTCHILVSGEIIIEGYKSGTIFGTHMTIDGVTYEKLGNVIVSFDAGDGIEAPESQTLSGDYKVTKPADPVREGYVFKGWTYPDGSDFDFNTVVTSSIRLVAKWEKSAETPSDPTDSEQTGCSGLVGSTTVLPGIALLAAASAGCILIGRKNRRKGE